MTEDFIPKVFISYSWNKSEFVLALAERLVSHGVDVVLDKWELKDGQDKYVFMEQCVNNPDISKVLIISDKQYTEKANHRKGGVGDETAIISTELYGRVNQEKFIPIATEYDEDGHAYMPTYIKSRIYIDLSNEDVYEENYEKLLRDIYNKPLYRKPKIGQMPTWLEDESSNYFKIEDLIRQLKGAKTEKKQKAISTQFIDEYIETLKDFYVEGLAEPSVVFSKFEEMLKPRNIFLDYVKALSETELDSGEILIDAFERMHNLLTNKSTFTKAASYNEVELDMYKIHIWELFICVTAFMIHESDYKSLGNILRATYFLKNDRYSNREDTDNYTEFRHHSRVIEELYKPTTDDKNKYTLLGDYICNKREYKPIYTKKNIAEADLFLYQVFKALDIKPQLWSSHYWFPTLYVYVDILNGSSIWSKLRSKRFCEKMFPLFGVETIDDLKDRISKCVHDEKMCYPGSFDGAPAILDYIKVEDIASLG